jgi:photosystem II stability/assembly factor-like uncharacterized protein
MHERDDLAEQLVELIDNAAAPLAFDEVVDRVELGSVAPRPRRARRLVAVAVVMAVVVGAGVLAVESRHTTDRPMPAVASTTTTSTAKPADIARTYRNVDPTGIMGVIGPESGWRLDGNSLSRTDDNGKTWRDITPPNAVNQDPIARISWVDFLDSQRVWVPVAVNSRQFTIYRSDNGGETWQAVCVGNHCGATVHAAFIDRDHGWGIGYGEGGNFETGNAYSTSDGGKTWTPLGRTPFVGPITFLNRQDGYGVSEPSGFSGSSGQATKPGGGLYQTRDGGRTWEFSAPSSADATTSFGLPQFFGPDGVVLRWSEWGLHDTVELSTTHDGGHTWFGKAPPSDPGSDRYGKFMAPQFPFSAWSPTDWMLFIGPKLYVTHDAGEHWETLTPAPAIGQVFSITQTSASSAWALAMVPVCDDPASTKQSCRLEILVHTEDGGRSWPAVPTP